jgi:hypothetical protein
MIKRIFKEIKLNPEWLGLPIVIIGWLSIKKALIYEDSTNAVIPNDIIQVFVLAVFGLLLGNFVAHLGIKFNHPTIWKQYRNSIENGDALPKEYFYSFCAYLLTYALMLLAIV